MNIGYVNVFVSDLEKSVAFYQQKLGLELEMSEPNFGYAAFHAGTIRLGLAVAGSDQKSLIGRHTGIGLSVTDLNQEYATLLEKGVIFSEPPTKQPWGGFMAIVEDPDGNRYYLDQYETTHN